MTNGDVLRDQYTNDRRLTARQSLWDNRTGTPLPMAVLDRAALDGSETVLDVGCGNGAYLAELRRRGHRGFVVGLDLSHGMAEQSRSLAATAVADVQALPLADDSVDVVLSLHMLYHVPDLALAVAELRRVLRPGGTAMITTNGPGHAAEVKRFLAAAAERVARIGVDADSDTHRFSPAVAANLLAGPFESVELHEAGDAFPVNDPAVLIEYIASWPPQSGGLRAGSVWDRILAAVAELVTAHFERHGSLTVTSRVAILRCR